MAFRFSTACFSEFLNTVVKTGFNDGIIDLYTGSQPSSPDAAPTGTFIGRITVNGGAWTAGSPTNGISYDVITLDGNGKATIAKTASEVWRFVAVAAGTIGWGRFKTNAVDADGVSTSQKRMDFSIGITSGDLRISKVTYAIGEIGEITTHTIPVTNVA